MLTQEIILKRRHGQPLARAEILQFVNGIANGSVGEGQVAAFCMATCIKPMTRDERVSLTLGMARSGITLDWSGEDLGGPVLDKHSTGGIGDKVSLMLAPIVAACGGYVPMLSGRGLGHTGGTLDKMDSIPGYVSQPDLDTIKRVVKNCGCAIIGATKDLAPADRIMYSIRDVTGTVESLDLITASILSKKMAAGLSGLAMDVKFGSGAFMTDYDDALALANSIVGVANDGGLPCTALMTDMNQALGHTAGNAIEVREAIEFLRNENIDPRLYEVTMALCAELLLLGKLAENLEDARRKAETVLKNGKAAEFFNRMVADLGGPKDIVGAYEDFLKLAPIEHPVYTPQPGIVKSVDVRKLGYAVIELGGGRRLVADRIDHSVGLSGISAPGEKIGPKDRPLCVIVAADPDKIARAETLIREAYGIAPPGASIEKNPVIR
ncbi:MAG TPA: thymidine phosphorylase, partial [Alphaproteobacteria bacterium]